MPVQMKPKMKNKNLYVITGGPGVGKTTLLKELEKHGYKTIPEEARRIIKEQIEINGNGLPWKNKELYGELMFKATLKTYLELLEKHQEQTVFFDRGILDTHCYFEMENIPITKEMKQITDEITYNNKVYILPPWQEIYETDTERKQTWEEALHTFNKMKETYQKHGYTVIEVPKLNTQNRAEFIIKQLNLK